MAGLCEGRVAIVTGAGRGVGREHALLLAANGGVDGGIVSFRCRIPARTDTVVINNGRCALTS